MAMASSVFMSVLMSVAMAIIVIFAMMATITMTMIVLAAMMAVSMSMVVVDVCFSIDWMNNSVCLSNGCKGAHSDQR